MCPSCRKLEHLKSWTHVWPGGSESTALLVVRVTLLLSLLCNGRPSPSVRHGARVGPGLVEAPAAQDERPPLLPELGAQDRVDDDVDRRVDH